MQTGMLRKRFRLVGFTCLLLALGLGVSCAPKPREKVTITFQTIENLPEQRALVREIIAAFEKEYPHIHVEPAFECFDKLHTQLAGNAGPDVFYYTADKLAALAEKGVAVDLTPMITLEKRSLDEFYADVVAPCKIDSRQFMMPVHYSTDILFYNVDLVQKAVAETRTYVNMQDLDWESIPKFAQAFVKEEGDRIERYAMLLPRPLLLIQSWGAQPFAWNDVTINNDQTRKALQYYVSLANEHHLAPTTAAQRESDAFDGVEMFRQQKVAFFVGRTYMLAEFEKIRDFRWDVAPVPKGPKRLQPGMPSPGSMEPPQPVEVWPRYSRLAVGGNCIWGNSPHFAEAWEFVKFYSSEPAQRILARARNAVPAHKVVAESESFLRKPPEHVDVLISSRAYSHLDNIHNLSFWDEFNQRAFTEITDQLLLGKITVEQAVEQMEKFGRELMDKSKK